MSSLFRSQQAAKAAPAKPAVGSTRIPAATPIKAGANGSTATPVKTTAPVEEPAKIAAWQSDMDSLEQQQMKIQQDTMNLLHNQIHILTRELGDLQKQFVFLQGDIYQKVDDLELNLNAAQEEAHAALRMELAEHGNNAQEMKAAWEEAHKALSDAMDGNLSELAEQHAKALEDHKSEQARALSEHAENLANHGSNLGDLEELHNKRYEEHSATLERGLEDVHGNLQKELAELRSGHEVNLRAIVEDITAQIDKLTLDMESLAKDVAASQEEAHSALRLELAEHGNNAAEMKAAWEEAHKALSNGMDEQLAAMAEDHAKALDAHKAEHAGVIDALTGGSAGSLSDLEELHNKRAEEHSACLEKGLEDVHGTLQKELAELRSGHAVNLQSVVADITEQIDKLTLDMESLATDVKNAQEEAHSALRLELAEHGNNAEEMKKAWEEANNALKESMDGGLADLAAQHVKALEDHAADQARALAEHAENHGNTVADIQAQLRGELDVRKDAHDDLIKSMDLKHGKHAEDIEKMEVGMRNVLENTHDKLQADLAELKSGHASNLKEILTDVTSQIDTLTMALEQEQELRKGVEEKLDEMFSSLRDVMSVNFLDDEDADADDSKK